MRLHVHEWGPPDAPPLLCLHGVTGWGGHFGKLAEERLDAFRVLAPDLRGHGASGWEPPWSLGWHVGDIVDTLDALGIEQVDVVGHSFGGRLAIELAARRPARAGRIALLDPAVWVPPRIALERAEIVRVDQSWPSIEDAVEEWLGRSGRAHPAVVAAELRRHLSRGEGGRWRAPYARSAVVAAYGEMAKPPPLDRVAAATLLIRGAESEVVPDKLVERVLATMPDCEVVTVPGGHIVMWDAFEETACALLGFLDGRPAPLEDALS